MSQAEFLEVRFGASRHLRVAQSLLASLGILAILASPASWNWKLPGILFLAMLAFWAHLRSFEAKQSGVIRLYEDGTALVQTTSGQKINAVQGGNNWVSRWLSVLTLQEYDNGRKHFCIICSSGNQPVEYRRLLKFLRMHTTQTKAQRMIW